MKHTKRLLTLMILLTLLLGACANTEDTPIRFPEPISSEFSTEIPDNELSTESQESQPSTESQDSEPSTETQESTPELTPSPTPETQQPIPADSTLVSHLPNVVNAGSTFTGLSALEPKDFVVTDPANARNLSTEKFSHAYGAAKDGAPHQISVDNQKRFDKYGTGALAWDNRTEEKVLYLTFDCGYEYENLTSVILDTLKEKNAPAAFFCTLDYLEAAPDITARMINEGHIVANHSTTHPSDSSLLTREKLAWELLGVDNYLRVNFGYDQCRYFRFPTGTYSENALELVYSLGYKSIFWSLAHADWDPNNQPGVEKSFQTVTNRLHPGAVILLHATSPDNAAILGRLIDHARAEGYEFRSLDDYPWDV